MLIAIRSKATSWIIKGLFVLIVASFAVWGIGDVFRNRGTGDQIVAKIGDHEIKLPEYNTQLNFELRRVSAALGQNISLDQAKAFGILDSTLERLVNEQLFEQAAKQLGLSAGTDLLRQRIAASPEFKGADGNFDANAFRMRLNQAQLTEAQYIDMLRADVVRSQVAGAVANGAAVSKTQAELIYTYRNEARLASGLFIPDDAITVSEQPDDAALKAFYDANQANYMAPEYRHLTVAALSADKIAEGIKIDDQTIEDEYKARQSEYTTDETRSISQAIVQDEATAKKLAETARSNGGDLKAAAAAAGAPDAVISDADDLTQDGFPAELADTIFKLPSGGVSDPVHSAFGWHVIVLHKITPSAVKPLAEVKDALAKELAHEKASDDLGTMIQHMQDDIAGGASLEEAAKTAGADIITVTSDSKGDDKSGKPVEGLTDDQTVIPALFAVDNGQVSDVIDAGGNSLYLGRVDSIDPSAARPLEEVHDQVLADWRKDEQQKRSRTLAQQLADKMREGASASATAAEQNRDVVTFGPVKRDGQLADASADASKQKVPPMAVVAAMFAAKQGDVSVIKADGGSYVFKLDEIKAADPKTAGDAVEALRKDLGGPLGNDLVTEMSAALRRTIGVTVNHQVIDSFYSSPTQ